MRKKIFLFTIMTIVLAVLLSFNVLAELQFTTNVTINDNIINDKNEEFYLTVSASNLPSEGLLSAQYYIEYDNTVFSVETDENAGSISQNSIEYIRK